MLVIAEAPTRAERLLALGHEHSEIKFLHQDRLLALM